MNPQLVEPNPGPRGAGGRGLGGLRLRLDSNRYWILRY